MEWKRKLLTQALPPLLSGLYKILGVKVVESTGSDKYINWGNSGSLRCRVGLKAATAALGCFGALAEGLSDDVILHCVVKRSP